MQPFSNFARRFRAQTHCLVLGAAFSGVCVLALGTPVHAAQVDIQGPTGFLGFGKSVTVLPNGNFVVTSYSVEKVGAVHLYRPDGTLVSTLSGSSAYDAVGGNVVVVGDSNFVVVSPRWKDNIGRDVGAVTWVNGTTGLNGVVSVGNSLVGSNYGDRIGDGGVVVLSNGNYVVSSPGWTDGSMPSVGAATWGDGSRGVSGRVSPGNSLVGTAYGDVVGSGGTIALNNGNYVVISSRWTNGITNGSFGAVTWGDGRSGIRGRVSANNSLVGARAGDMVGSGGYTSIAGVTALNNGNYVVVSANWANGDVSGAGAVTWGDGRTGIRGPVSVGNSLVGTTLSDEVGSNGVTALINGNYVVASPNWSNGVWGRALGAATWADGRIGSSGTVRAANSIVGTNSGDRVGSGGVTALGNGNYVVASPAWSNGQVFATFGAATWGDGSIGSNGSVSSTNSLVGAMPDDEVSVGPTGRAGVIALSNGNYVVVSPNWNTGNESVGAVTWGNGSGGVHGLISIGNSLIGSTAGDAVGAGGITALSNGNYVVVSPSWNNGVRDSHFGAATWADGGTGATGYVSPQNSLVGTAIDDHVGFAGAIAVGGGNYVVTSTIWNSGAGSAVGAVTWGHGERGVAGAISSRNSLVGTAAHDLIGGRGVIALGDGDYLVISQDWNARTGAATLADSRYRSTGTIESWNSALGKAPFSGDSMTSDYDAVRHRLIVGWPADNLVSIFTRDRILASDFEP